MKKKVFLCALMMSHFLGLAQKLPLSEQYYATHQKGTDVGKSLDWNQVKNDPILTGSKWSPGFGSGMVDGINEDCSFSTPSNDHENGLGYLEANILANDFKVEAGKTFRPTKLIYYSMESRDTKKVTIRFYQDNGGQPGSLITQTAPITPTSLTNLGYYYGSFIVVVEVDLPGTLSLQGGENGTTYWMGLTVENEKRTYWESTSIMNTDNPIYFTLDGGITWTASDSIDGVFDLLGECTDSPEGCTLDVFGQYPSGNFTPQCAGYVETIADDGWYGEYSAVNVTAGNQYIFKTNHSSDLITITNGTGNTVYSSEKGEVIWVAPATETVRFYTHLDEECNITLDYVKRSVQCGNLVIVNEPNFTCFQGDGLASNSGEDGLFIGGSVDYNVADDFVVTDGTVFKVKQVRLNVVSESPITEGTLRFYEDVDGSPFELEESVTMAPSLARIVDSAFGLFIYELTFNLPTQLEFFGGTHWLSPVITNQTGTAVYWEITSSGTNGRDIAITEVNGTWTDYEGYQGVFFISGRCMADDAGCLDAPNGMYPEFVFSPACIGTPETITGGNNGMYGNYSMVEVQEGTTYTFSTNYPTAFITIGDAEGETILAFDYEQVIWTAPFNGQIRFYTHLDEFCMSSYENLDRLVQCGELLIITEPDFPCFQGDGISPGFENSWIISSSNEYRVADDINVPSNSSFEVKQIRMNILSPTPLTEMKFDFAIDQNGLPGEIFHTISMAPTSYRKLGHAFMMELYEVEFDLEEPFTLETGRYWMIPVGTDSTESMMISWEATFEGNSGSPAASSEDQGATWAISPTNSQMIFFVAGECITLGMDDFDNFDFTYYPNPVKDVLKIDSKKEIISVEVFNMAGQKLMSLRQISKSGIQLNSLPQGIYVFKVVLEGGQVETFKIIKQ